MSYLVFVAGFGAATVLFLWLRDARIFFRTGLSGYRNASYRGVLYTALGLVGVFVALTGFDILGLGIILIALYLQGKADRERVFTNESTIERFFGAVQRRKNKDSA